MIEQSGRSNPVPASVFHVMFITGYAALFKHPNEELNYCVYLIPGNPRVVPEDLAKWHDRLLKDPYISRALGDNFKIERMKAGESNKTKFTYFYSTLNQNSQ